MPEYIEKEALIDYLTRPTGLRADCEDCTDVDCLDCIVEEVIHDRPAADVAPVRHGRWADGKCTVCGWEEPDVCSYYGYEAESWIHTPYCPMCGALMDGGEPDA